MHRQIQLRDIMQKEIFTVFPEDFVERAAKLLKSNEFHHLPVVDEEREVVGIVSTSDLDRISYGHTLFKMPDKDKYDQALHRSLLVQDVMSTRVFTMAPTDSIEAAYQQFRRGQFRAVPVVDGDRLVGIVTPLDLVEALLNHASTL